MADTMAYSLAQLKRLAEANQHGEATHRLLGSIAEMLASGLSSQEKLNHLLFMSRAVQASGGAKHGYQKLLRKVRRIKAELAVHPNPPAGGMLDLGCGTHDPLALAAYFALNGFEPAYCCDLSGPRNEFYSALSMYEIMANIRAFPARYRFRDARIVDILERWKQFDVEEFERGELMPGLGRMQDRLTYHVGDILGLAAPAQSLSVVVSFAVLEHVQDLEAVNRWLYERTAPGGLHFHFIDMADHRSYEVGSKTDPLAFLTEAEAPAGMNRVRASEHLAAFERAGFQVLKASRKKAALDDDIAGRLLPPWRDMSEDDLTTLKLTVVLRRPAQV
jgi:SAM-dependent methyltransferase